jgi:hypothetical protein
MHRSSVFELALGGRHGAAEEGPAQRCQAMLST